MDSVYVEISPLGCSSAMSIGAQDLENEVSAGGRATQALSCALPLCTLTPWQATALYPILQSPLSFPPAEARQHSAPHLLRSFLLSVVKAS